MAVPWPTYKEAAGNVEGLLTPHPKCGPSAVNAVDRQASGLLLLP